VAALGSSREQIANRARDWHHAEQQAMCDLLEPWAQGTILRATRYPSYFAYNLLRVERDPGMSAEELVSIADQALAGYAHRRIDVEDIAAAERLRPALETRGFKTMRLLWMRHQAQPPPGPHVHVGEVAYDTVAHLRLRWHQEDSPDQRIEYQQWAREIALRRGVQVLSISTAGEPVAFAQLAHQGRQAEITEVYVDARHRGAGLGAALTRAAIESAGDVDDLWICADEQGRAKELYARLGFRPAWSAMEFTLWPEAVDDISKRSP
jgi:ribosomal protein S18 acetylase RimI-like enzyme